MNVGQIRVLQTVEVVALAKQYPCDLGLKCPTPDTEEFCMCGVDQRPNIKTCWRNWFFRNSKFFEEEVKVK